MRILNNLDLLNNLWIIGSIILLLLAIRIIHLRKKKMSEVQINIELANAETALERLKNYEREGLNRLLSISNSSKYPEVKDSVQKLLLDFNTYFNKKHRFTPVNQPNWKKLKEVPLSGIEKQFTDIFDETPENIWGRLNLVNATNTFFATNFKVYEFEKVKDWYNTGEYLKMIEKSKEMDFE